MAWMIFVNRLLDYALVIYALTMRKAIPMPVSQHTSRAIATPSPTCKQPSLFHGPCAIVNTRQDI